VVPPIVVLKTEMTFTRTFLSETRAILDEIDADAVERMAEALAHVRSRGGRLFILGVGGSAAHASHAVNDFRKLCAFEAYSPSDNVSELTARINDDGWASCFSAWLKGCRINAQDAVLVFSVGGGNRERNISGNIVAALETAQSAGSKVFGIVGRDGGFTSQVADVCVKVPSVSDERITPHTEGISAVVLHLLVSHPSVQVTKAKWESMQ
jgi:D-sedoheptulose 7-phosphate isomerase